ncbi:uncharacterized protein SOCE26_045010 [Sorangium cellulosum]|uniref:Uncharacterized protein n=1 Tax=Sorangium cellulosum TaxID=56 RepID=A0A2L0EUU0_SORCE|nr:uncharacterized protein SOCE26_045010 [Sorangium cellulosum]
MTCKDIKADSFEPCWAAVTKVIQALYREHRYPLDAGWPAHPSSSSNRIPAAWSRSMSRSPIATAGVSTPARAGSRSRSSAMQSADSATIFAVSE